MCDPRPDRSRQLARRPDADEARRRFATACLLRHYDREHHFLSLAVEAADDASSRLYEVWADDAYRDALAVAAEHELPDDG